MNEAEYFTLGTNITKHFHPESRKGGGGWGAVLKGNDQPARSNRPCLLPVDGDSGEGEHHAAAYGDAEGAGRLEDAAQ